MIDDELHQTVDDFFLCWEQSALTKPENVFYVCKS